jgi:colanic acid/amylovoran biosynthesis glycosyltransferase
MSHRMMRIAYLAPAFPAISSTFVQDELVEVERFGHTVFPVTVRRPSDPATDQAALAERTYCLYSVPHWRLVLEGVLALPRYRGAALRSVSWLVRDILEVGLQRRAAWKLCFQFLAGVRLAGWLRRWRCDHLHVHFAHVPAQIAMYSSALTGIPFTVTAHANDLFQHGLLLRRKAERARRVLAISSFNRDWLVERGVDPACVAVVRCAARLPESTQRELTPAGQVIRIGTLGRLVEKKGVDVLLDAFALVVGGDVDVRLSIAGEGPLRSALESQIHQLGLADYVDFVGALTHVAVVDWMKGLDAFVLACKPDRYGDMDGIPVVLMEAMSQRIAVLATRLSGIPELVIHERTGLKARPSDSVDLAAQLLRLVVDPELRGRLAEAGALHVANEFSSARNVKRLLAQFAGPEAVSASTEFANTSRAEV